MQNIGKRCLSKRFTIFVEAHLNFSLLVWDAIRSAFTQRLFFFIFSREQNCDHVILTVCFNSHLLLLSRQLKPENK